MDEYRAISYSLISSAGVSSIVISLFVAFGEDFSVLFLSFAVIVPIFGLIGWFAGRGFYHMRWGGRAKTPSRWSEVASRLIGKPIVLLAFIVWCALTFSLVFDFAGVAGLGIFIAINGIGILIFLHIAALKQDKRA